MYRIRERHIDFATLVSVYSLHEYSRISADVENLECTSAIGGAVHGTALDGSERISVTIIGNGRQAPSHSALLVTSDHCTLSIPVIGPLSPP